MGAEGDSSEPRVGNNGGEDEGVMVNIRCSNGTKFTVRTSLESTVGVFKSVLTQNCDVPADQQPRERESKYSDGKDGEVLGGGYWSAFIDNLSRRVRRRTFGEHFSYHGKVIRVFIPFINNRPKYKDCTFAFVHFASKKDLCNAVEKMNNVRIAGKIISVSVAKYDKLSKLKSREGASEEGFKKVEIGELKGRRLTSPAQGKEKMERMSKFLDGRTYRDTVVGVKKVSEGHQISSQRNVKEEKKSLEVFIPMEERLWLKSSLTGICKDIFEVEFVQKALRNEGFKVKVIRWGYAKNGVCLASRRGKVVKIQDQTAHRVDCRVAQLLLRVESPYDIPEQIIITTYGRQFMIKIKVDGAEDFFPELTDMEVEEVAEEPWEESSSDWSKEDVQNRQEEQVGVQELSEPQNRIEYWIRSSQQGKNTTTEGGLNLNIGMENTFVLCKKVYSRKSQKKLMKGEKMGKVWEVFP
ncbi:hypothetical protein F3Y22_tig00009308pilonHSYRG00006 [Hibiscus syriacus]|uniref:RRM domain-containing protein n=1 Tax=Hibiscus syriacus TaxID=106335 RepID=A0A6A3C834_HIBSY|nr:hypothetical protein F3Y22_tig00009308pilonHSYRG00006 [Hibiscus syriacus]